jgi:UDP-N-acetylglucosamine 2-epimerase
MARPEFFARRSIRRGEYYLMTCHRRENVHMTSSFQAPFDSEYEAFSSALNRRRN